MKEAQRLKRHWQARVEELRELTARSTGNRRDKRLVLEARQSVARAYNAWQLAVKIEKGEDK